MNNVLTARRPLITRLAQFAVMGALALSGSTLRADGIGLRQTVPSDQKIGEALSLLGQGRLEKADALFQAIAGSEPSHVYALLGRAQVAVIKRNLAQADRAVTEVLERHDTMPEAHNMKGVVLLMQNDEGGARREFLRAIELHPLYVTPRLYLAAMSRASKDYVQAAREYKTLTEIAPRLPAGYLGQAEAEMMQNHTAQAFRILESWKHADAGSIAPSQVIATLYVATGEPQKALQELRGALEQRPGDSTTIRITGDAYAAAGETEQAIRQYRGALAADSRNIEAALGLGNVQLRSGDKSQALVTYRNVLAVDAMQPIACNNVAWLLAEQRRNLDEALRLGRLAIKADPRFVDAYDTLGWVHYLRHEYTQAVTVLEKGKSLAANRTDIAGHLGLAYAKAGSKQRALTELRRALASPEPLPNRSDLQRAVDALTSNARDTP
jgi:tetratricopeptide (TPR) repeat protein